MDVRRLIQAAQNGVAEAEYVLGLLHENGLCSTAGCGDSESWYRRAAERGFAAAQFEVALLCRRILQKDARHREATDWLRKSAENGYFPAQMHLGMCLLGGLWGEVAPEEGWRWM